MMDEIGMYYSGALPDRVDPGHDTLRKEVLWGHLMAGGAGVEWYFGYKYPPADLDCEDWRSRDILWEQTHHAWTFFNEQLPFWEMHNRNDLTPSPGDYCMAKEGELYALYLPQGGNAQLDLEDHTGQYKVSWFNPRTGGEPRQGSVPAVKGPGLVQLGSPPADPGKDWAVLVKRVE